MSELEQLKTQVSEKFNSLDGTFALAFKTIEPEPKQILINENEIFHAASTMKTAVMIEAFRQAKAGFFNLNDSITVKNEFKSIVDSSFYSMDIDRDSGENLYDFIGSEKSIYDLVYAMIIHSSNLATNLVIGYLGAENVSKTVHTMGAKNMQVLRGVEDMKAFDAGLNNTTSALDLMILFEAIAADKAVDPQSSREMVRILSDQKHNDMIPALLPKEARVAHKTGSISGVRHDSGIVYLPDGRKYVMVLLSKNLKNPDEAEKHMAEISLMIYQFINKS